MYFSIYCCSLWTTPIKRTSSLKIAHNDALRIIFGLPRYARASENFVSRNLNNIDFVLRNSVYSLMKRLESSENTILWTIVNSVAFKNSKLYLLWNSLLYVDH